MKLVHHDNLWCRANTLNDWPIRSLENEGSSQRNRQEELDLQLTCVRLFHLTVWGEKRSIRRFCFAPRLHRTFTPQTGCSSYTDFQSNWTLTPDILTSQTRVWFLRARAEVFFMDPWIRGAWWIHCGESTTASRCFELNANMFTVTVLMFSRCDVHHVGVLACSHQLISSKHIIQLRLMGMSSGLQVFGLFPPLTWTSSCFCTSCFRFYCLYFQELKLFFFFFSPHIIFKTSLTVLTRLHVFGCN